MKLVVTGAGGQLGQAIVRRFRADHEVVGLPRAALDLSRHADVLRAMAAERPHVIVNCAAYTNVDGAEEDAMAALDANAFAVRSLARAAVETGAALVHYSTDFVFDGDAAQPYTEDDLPAPQSIYAQSKLLGEWLAADAPRHYVLRVESLFGGPMARSSIDRIIDAVSEDRDARVFVDRVVSPSYVDDVADATAALLDRQAPAGVYHCVNTGHATWHEVAVEIARLLERPAPRLVPVRVADVKLRAPRPQYAALSNAKLAAAGITMPTWQDALRRHLQARATNR